MTRALSLSTMWSPNYERMPEFYRDACEFGFTHIELNSILTPERLQALLAIEGIPISSIHSPCPDIKTREGMTRTLSLSSLDADERQAAVGVVASTIDLAAEVGVETVIVHAGHTDMDPQLEKDLRKLWEQTGTGGRDYDEAKRKLAEIRRFSAHPHVNAARESLLTLASHARPQGVRLALENRVHFHEIPSIGEMMDILCAFQPEVVGYWHDVGHAEVQARLGFTPHEDWFAALGDRILGVHLHDIRGLRDHNAPGTGEMDWAMVARNLPADVIRVCEIGEWNPTEDTRRAVAFLRQAGIVKAH